MDTLDMMAQAKIDGKIYQHGDELFYAFETGFVDEDGHPFECGDLPFSTLNEFIDYQWKQIRSMTRAEAEAKLGIKIVG